MLLICLKPITSSTLPYLQNYVDILMHLVYSEFVYSSIRPLIAFPLLV